MADQNWRATGGYDLDGAPEDKLEVVEENYRKYKRPDAEDPEEARRRSARARRRFLFGIALVAAVVTGLLALSSMRHETTTAERMLDIGSLSDAFYLLAYEDTTAVGYIRRKFPVTGRSLPFVDGVVAEYLFLNYPVEVWVGIAPLQESAAEAYSLLIDETDPAINSNWRNQSQFIRQNTPITQVAGRGQRHYFFRQSNMVVWVATDSVTAPFALQAVLNTDLRNWIQTVRQGG
jgi:hypothetical protein